MRMAKVGELFPDEILQVWSWDVLKLIAKLNLLTCFKEKT